MASRLAAQRQARSAARQGARRRKNKQYAPGSRPASSNESTVAAHTSEQEAGPPSTQAPSISHLRQLCDAEERASAAAREALISSFWTRDERG
jgi:hypothetical protein